MLMVMAYLRTIIEYIRTEMIADHAVNPKVVRSEMTDVVVAKEIAANARCSNNIADVDDTSSKDLTSVEGVEVSMSFFTLKRYTIEITRLE